MIRSSAVRCDPRIIARAPTRLEAALRRRPVRTTALVPRRTTQTCLSPQLVDVRTPCATTGDPPSAPAEKPACAPPTKPALPPTANSGRITHEPPPVGGCYHGQLVHYLPSLAHLG